MKRITWNHKLRNILAISLISISFLLYAIMPFNVCLPFSACVITGVTGAMMVISEVVFWIGSLMIGREAARRLRNKFSIKNAVTYIKRRQEKR